MGGKRVDKSLLDIWIKVGFVYLLTFISSTEEK